MKIKTYGKQSLLIKLQRKLCIKKGYKISDYFCNDYKKELVSKGFHK
jgi:hypothetical protein